MSQKLLPEGCEVPTSFESVGHIAHLNLRDELLPYKHVIGQVLLDKNSSIRTVVNKVSSTFPAHAAHALHADRLLTSLMIHVASFHASFG